MELPMTDSQTAQASRDLVEAWVDRCLPLQELLEMPAHAWLKDSLAHDIAAALQTAYDAGAQAELVECTQAIAGRITHYKKTHDANRLMRDIQINEAEGCLFTIRARGEA